MRVLALAEGEGVPQVAPDGGALLRLLDGGEDGGVHLGLVLLALVGRLRMGEIRLKLLERHLNSNIFVTNLSISFFETDEIFFFGNSWLIAIRIFFEIEQIEG